MSLPRSCDVVIVGAGLAGLTAARDLSLAGRDVHIVEATERVGGRVRTDSVDGLLLDRGFQLYNPSYREGRRVLDIERLDIRTFTAGVIVSLDGRHHHMADPRHEPRWAVDSLTAPFGTLAQRAKFAAYALSLVTTRRGAHLPDGSCGPFLQQRFGTDLTDSVLRPFLAGVFLEDAMDTSLTFFDTVLRSFLRGTPGVPAGGMQQIPLQLAAQLPAGSLHVNTTALSIAPDRVETSQGTVECRQVIVATAASAAAELVDGLAVPTERDVTTWYHLADCAPSDLTGGKSTVVVDGLRFRDGTPDPARPLVNSVVMTHAAPTYATGGRILVSSSALGLHPSDAAEAAARRHMAVLHGVDTSGWTHVATHPVARALPAMPGPHTPADVRFAPHLYIAGDHREVSSIDGAIASGRRAGQAALADRP